MAEKDTSQPIDTVDVTEISETDDGKIPNGGSSLTFYFRIFGLYSDPLDHVLRVIGCVAACAAGVAPPLMTLVFGSSVDQFNDFGAGGTSSEELYHSICKNALWFLYLFIGRLALIYIHTTCFGIAAIRTNSRFRQAFIRSLISQDVTFLDSCSPGTVAATITNNADTVENGIGEKVGGLLQAVAMFVAAFVVAFTRMWDLTLVTATTMPLLLGGFIITFGLDAKIEGQIMEIHNTAGGLVEEAMSTIRIVTAFDARQKLRKKYDAYLARAQALGFKKGPILGVQYSVDFFSTFCGYALAWYYGIKVLNRDHINNGGQIVTVLLAVLLGTASVSTVSFSFGDVTMASAAAKGMFEMIDRKSKIDPLNETGKRLDCSDLTVRLSDVTFAYPSRANIKVLDNINLTFDAGKVIALVGASGSGKSTIVGLIERWFDPDAGYIEVGGVPARDLNLRWLRSQIGLVQQEPFLFDDTIYANVAHGLYGSQMDSLPEEQKRELVRQACAQAYIDDFIQELPKKYDTRVGERGNFLSGGQKQRIAIARSIVSNPRVLLLDEATSALDPTAEKQVQAALDNVSKSRTTIMIAHKLSTVRNADKIVVLSRGQVVEQGTHEELLEKKGAYHELVSAQNLDMDSGEESSDVSIDRSKSSDDETSEGLEKASSVISRLQPIVQGEADSTDGDESEDKDVARKFSLARCLAIIIFKEQRRIWPLFLAGFIASTCGGGLFPGQAVLFGQSIVTFQIPPDPEFVSRGDFWALMYFVFSLVVLVSYLGVGFFWTMAAFHATRFYRREYFDSMLRQDISFFDFKGHGAAEMTGRLTLHSAHLQGLLSTNLAMIVIVIVNIVSCCVLSLVVGWQLGLVVIVGCMPLLFGSGFARMRLEMANQDSLTANYLDCARFATEAVGAIRTVSSLTIEGKVLNGYQERLDMCSRQMVRAKFISMLLFALSESLDLAASGLAFWYGGKLLSEGKYNVTTFFTVFIAVIQGSQAAGNLFGFTANTTKAQSAANHIIQLRRSLPPINTSTGIKDPQSVDEKTSVLEFQDVSFAYPSRPNLPVLQNLNLSVNRGESVGIVGSSGCGKSTLIALMERFYDIESGKLLVQGTPIQDIDVHHHRSRIGLVSQDTTLYHGTIRDNVIIGLSDTEISATSEADIDKKVISACESANIHEFVMSLPDGYATDIGNRGVSLSGGQRQRLAIARALIRDPEILIFDEATSALDTANEALVQSAIETISREKSGCTTISVAHRLSTIKRCDRIFVLHRGQVVEVGTHQDLIKLRGRYYQMALTQALDREVETQ